jgi:hypothetical protein
MARVILTEAGATQFLKQQVGLEEAEPLWLRLYGNPHQPNRKDDLLNYTECGGHAYAPKLIKPSEWTVINLDHGLVGVIAPPQIWTFGDGPPMRVYGSYATGSKRSRLLYWGDPLEGNYVLVERRGQQLEIQPCLIRALAPDSVIGG